MNYGIVCFGSTPLPDDLMSSLTAWEKTMFFAGAWFDRKRDYSDASDVASLVKRYIKTGYDKLHEMHMVKYHEGKYDRPLKIPESQNFRRSKGLEPTIEVAVEVAVEAVSEPVAQDSSETAAKYADRLNNHLVYDLLKKEQAMENPPEDLSERIAIMLDSCTDEQRRDLTIQFGKKALGGYAVD